MGEHALEHGERVGERGDVGGEVLVDARERDAVVAQVRGAGDVQVVDVAREARAQAERERGLQVPDLRGVSAWLAGAGGYAGLAMAFV
jgi:hypothetical protein